MGEIMDGKRTSKAVRELLKPRAAALREAGIVPRLDVILVGEDPASAIYVGHKAKAAAKVGIEGHTHRLEATTSEAELLALIDQLNADPSIHGILVQLPLPDHIDINRVLFSIDPSKDVDGFHFINAGHLATDRVGRKACTPKGIMRLLKEYDVETRGKHAVVIGRSRVVGRPMGAMLLAANATVTICHRHTPDTREFSRNADILISATGIAGLVGPDWVKPGAVVVDVGITRGDDGRLCGDVQFDAVLPIAGLLTPVPGGVGPMTIAMLLENTCEAAESVLTRRTELL